jgi:hypothetical protein
MAFAADVPPAILAAYSVRPGPRGASERVWCIRARAAKNFVSPLARLRGRDFFSLSPTEVCLLA